jgi:hypothetical protein
MPEGHLADVLRRHRRGAPLTAERVEGIGLAGSGWGHPVFLSDVGVCTMPVVH